VLGALAASAATASAADAPAWKREASEQARILLRVASRLWPAVGQSLAGEFVRVARDSYGALMEPLDFAGDAEASRCRINAWVEEATKERIVDLVAPRQIAADAKLVVTSAAYFRARWTQTFDEQLTRRAPFFAPRAQVTVRLMKQTATFSYAEAHDAQIVDLAYGTGDVVMRVALPRDGKGLADLEPHAFEVLAARLRPTCIRLFLPKFRVESRLQLTESLIGMGMPSVFEYRAADLSGIDGTRELYVSSVLHGAFVEVDEEGTEAAAATVITTSYGGAPRRPQTTAEMRVDRPFLFWIVHRPTGAVLFSGRVTDP
jgi:serpin B